jgi:hypothetical protein
LFTDKSTFGEREAMFFAKDNQIVDPKQLDAMCDDPTLEMALFRSAHWPYYGYPKGFIARLPGEYKVRFSARAVLQQPGHKLAPATQPVPMTFRARKPSGPDVSGDVRATGGIMDVPPGGKRPLRRSSACFQVRPLNTACSVSPCRSHAMSKAARRPIATLRSPKEASPASPFNGSKSKARSHRRHGRLPHIAFCLVMHQARMPKLCCVAS